MKKLNLLLALSMTLLCANQPIKAEHSWTSWIAPAVTSVAAIGTMFSACCWYRICKDLSKTEKIDMQTRRENLKKNKQENHATDLTIKNKNLGDYPTSYLVQKKIDDVRSKKIQSQIATGAFSILTLGLVAYNWK